MRRLIAVLAGVACIGAARSCIAAPSTDEVASMLTTQGATVSRTDRVAGDPYFDVVTDGLAWRVYFVDCAGHPAVRCASMTAQAGLSHVTKKSFAVVNAWNATRRFSRAFLDADGDPNLANDIVLQGNTADMVAAALRLWREDLARYHAYLE